MDLVQTGGITEKDFPSPDGSRIVTASEDKTARIWDAASAKEIAVLRGHDRGVTSAAFSPDGSRIVTASEDRTARIWDAPPAPCQPSQACGLRPTSP
jgi:WD40 repeat protein